MMSLILNGADFLLTMYTAVNMMTHIMWHERNNMKKKKYR